ncbi:hypothetical protein [Paraburkholderia tagetis]|uniref:Uncharacterized protein n=1 Tax=Paraburkholderia tagetis TaxID=2913261 RepID=A0A9X1UDY3_9BURK|nr:hypothetical protein [Paraburkholderia tagetis]MCG5072610.1 hypothetical protein [Paraburkholderia tagetis]
MSFASVRIIERVFAGVFVATARHARGMKCRAQHAQGADFIATSFVVGTTKYGWNLRRDESMKRKGASESTRGLARDASARASNVEGAGKAKGLRKDEKRPCCKGFSRPRSGLEGQFASAIVHKAGHEKRYFVSNRNTYYGPPHWLVSDGMLPAQILPCTSETTFFASIP